MSIAEDQLLTPKQAAEYIGLSERTLANWRSQGVSDLPFIKRGYRYVRYRKSDLDAWLEQGTVTSTTEHDHGTS